MKDKTIRQMLLDFVTTLNKEGGLDNEKIAKLHFDLTEDRFKSMIEGLAVGLVDPLDWDKWSKRVDKL